MCRLSRRHAGMMARRVGAFFWAPPCGGGWAAAMLSPLCFPPPDYSATMDSILPISQEEEEQVLPADQQQVRLLQPWLLWVGRRRPE